MRSFGIVGEELLRALLLGVVDELFGGAFLHDHAAIHEEDAVRNVAGKVHLVGDDDHGRLAVGKVAQDAHLYRNATMYLRYLRIIDRESDKLELKLRHSMQNREILMLLELSKTLVYFTTSLKSNEIVMEKLTTLPRIKQYPEDEDLLDDVITENKQAIEMANIYSGVLANMTDAFASIVSNNLNNVMRIFTIISITLSIPTLIFSMYGMNFQEGMLGMPLTDKPWGFAVIIGISLVVSAIVTWFLTRSRMFK